MFGILFEVCCNTCKKPIKDSQFAAHAGVVASFPFVLKLLGFFMWYLRFDNQFPIPNSHVALSCNIILFMSKLLSFILTCICCWLVYLLAAFLFGSPLFPEGTNIESSSFFSLFSPILSELCRSLKLTEQTSLELDGNTGNRKPPRREKKKLSTSCACILKIRIY